jgi:hypothetical protein
VTYEDLEKTGWLYEVGTGFLHTPCSGEREKEKNNENVLFDVDSLIVCINCVVSDGSKLRC